MWLLCWYELWTLWRIDFHFSLCSLLNFFDGFSCPLACDQSCKSCGPNSPRCLTCAEKTVLHDGKCISECPGGYYADATGKCKGKTWVIVTIVTIIIIIIKKVFNTCLIIDGAMRCSFGSLCAWWRNGKLKGISFPYRTYVYLVHIRSPVISSLEITGSFWNAKNIFKIFTQSLCTCKPSLTQVVGVTESFHRWHL